MNLVQVSRKELNMPLKSSVVALLYFRVQFANSVAGLPMDNYVYTDDLVAFSRGRRGFVVIGEAKGERFYTG